MKKENDKPEEPTAELIGKAQGGDMDALGKLWESCQARVAWILRNKFREISHYDIEDILQKTGIKVSKSIGKFRVDSSFETWVTGIAINNVLDYLRKLKRRMRTGQLYEGIDVCTNTHQTPLEILKSRERVRKIYEMIHSLPEKQRICILMLLDGKRQIEISKETGFSERMVHYYIQEAKKVLV